MLADTWTTSQNSARELGITEFQLSYLRENGYLKPGIHWKSCPEGQNKPWNPQALYNIKMCIVVIRKLFLRENDNIAA